LKSKVSDAVNKLSNNYNHKLKKVQGIFILKEKRREERGE